MKPDVSNAQARLYLAASLLLIVALASSLFIFLKAGKISTTVGVCTQKQAHYVHAVVQKLFG